MRTRYTPTAYTYWANIYCHDCGVGLPEVDPEGNEKGVVAPWQEVADYDEDGMLVPCHCGQCGGII